MPLKSDQIPSAFNPRALWEAVKQLQRDVRELRAARTLEQSAIGDGGLTVQGAGASDRIVLVPKGVRGFDDGAGGTYYPPGIMFYSGLPQETIPGEMTAYEAVGVMSDRVPTIRLQTGDIGSGSTYLKLQAGDPGGPYAAASIVANGASYLFAGNQIIFNLNDGTQIVIDSLGVFFGQAGEGWTNLSLANGWANAGTPWGPPQIIRQIDYTVELRGTIVPGTLASGTVIANVPTAWQPFFDVEFRLPGGSATAYCDVVVKGSNSGASAGQVIIQNIAGTITRLSLSAIRYGL